MDQNTWGELRSMLQRPGRANEAWWTRLLDRLAAFDESTRAGAIDYVALHMNHHTAAWPAHIAHAKINVREESGLVPSWVAPLIRTLEVHWFGDDDSLVQSTLAKLDVPGLSPTHLEFTWSRYSEASFLALMQAPALANVKSISFASSIKQSIRALEHIPQLEQLREISFDELDDEHVYDFSLVMRDMSALVSLGIHGGIDRKPSWKHIIDALPDPLIELDVSGLRLENKYIKQLSEGGALSALDTLNMARCYLGGSGSKALARIDNARIETLDLSGNDIGAAGIKALCEASFAGSLRTLLLVGNSLRTASTSIDALGNAGILSQLEHLDVSDSDLNSSSAKKLFAHDLSRMKRLGLRRTTHNTASLESLVSCAMPELEELDLSECQLDADALSILTDANWPRLHTLRIDQDGPLTSQECERALREHFDDLVSLHISDTVRGHDGP